MCGILYYYGDDNETILDYLKNIYNRGPDHTDYICIDKHFFGFNRLMINGINNKSNQPFYIDDTILIVNGEIFNWKKLLSENPEFKYRSDSDCEIILHMYNKYGIEKTIKSLDGEFAFILYDTLDDKLFVGRDHLGIRGLFIGKSNDEIMIGSELKSIKPNLQTQQFLPGHYYYNNKFIKYTNKHSIINHDYKYIKKQLNILLTESVKKRLMSDRPIACLLSGGLDSTLVCAIVKNTYDKPLNTYSIGIKGSTDLKYAKMASEFLKTNHTAIELTEREFINAIEETIKVIESYDTTTVRASVGNYLISKYIKNNTTDTVLFCGDVSDELFGSYRGFMKAPTDKQFIEENNKMLHDIHFFDVLRSDRSISGASLEARVPFSDKEFVDFVMSLHPKYKMFNENKIEKHILREAFEGYLPQELLYRKKEAFSDGVSSVERSWFTIIQEFVENKISDTEFQESCKLYTHNPPYDKESLYYRNLFEKYYKGKGEIIPYFWKHPFCTEIDPSARKLDCY